MPRAPRRNPGALTGRTVVVTRAETRSSPLTDRLEALGAEVVVAPCIATEAPSDGGAALSDAIARLDDAAVIALTSPTGARRLLAALAEAGLDGAALDGTTVAAVGPGTASVLSAAGVRVDVVPDDHVGEGLLDALGEPRIRAPGLCSPEPRWPGRCSPTVCAPEAGWSTWWRPIER
ncbi:MAG: uroporphyrinogen-III synthase [Microthrixaceae bacterium]